ncbi:caspase family protein [Stieleria varia]|uniref:Caspase domain protein n=1 Tax=Stieleria varia TaxID=2528005 RepID=A0A5C6B2H0_9BACT|nr:caspase family protein [Stieleria varia]TWU04604.1 Caspase domain protein [Stieleria varia]
MDTEHQTPRAAFGLFVGVDDYRNEIVPDLNYCCKDAKGLSEAFDTRPSAVTMLLLEQDATRRNVLTQLNFMMTHAEPGDLLLFFVATHGVVKYNDFFFMPYDADPQNLLGTGISSKLLINALASTIHRGVECLIVFDSCYCGAIGFDISKSQTVGKGGLSCLFSASPLEKSIESPSRRQGIFSHFMIEGLKGKAARDQTGPNQMKPVYLRDLYDYVYSRTKRATQQQQHPVLIGTLDNETVLNEISS